MVSLNVLFFIVLRGLVVCGEVVRSWAVGAVPVVVLVNHGGALYWPVLVACTGKSGCTVYSSLQIFWLT